MICNHCKRESDPASRICPYCGKFMGDEEAPILAGEAVPVYDDSDYRPKDHPGKSKHSKKRRQTRRKKTSGRADAKRRRKENYRRPMINWAAVALVILIFGFALGVGAYVYLQLTPNGQLILARMDREASPDAYWTLGGEYLDQGYIARSVETYEKALALNPEHPQLVDKLMLLAEAYETASRQKDAEEIYTRIYKELAPTSPNGYKNAIRLMLQQNRQSEAAELMKEAAEETGDDSFLKQRAGMVPLPPTATVASGRYLISKTVEFVSSQGYQIYYTTGGGELPETGIVYTGPINLGEGTHSFRAVCVASELVSDPMEVKYVVTLPTPPAPKSNLSAGSYNGARSIRLRDMEEDKKDPLKAVTIYYTLDGTPPSAEDSPRYVGEPIELAGGKTIVRAISVNGYGKVSNEMNVEYDIKNKPFKKYFNADDEFAKFTLMKTDYEAFVALYGQPDRFDKVEDEDMTGQSYEAIYSWGEARFVESDIGRLIYYINTDDSSMIGPRGVKVGMDMVDITAQFRDMGQLPNDRGDRGIYYNIASGRAAYKVASDDPTTGELSYMATLFKDTDYTRLLNIEIQAGKAVRITFSHVGHKVSNII